MALDAKTVLVVDDDELVLSLLEADLRQAGFAVLTAPHGKEALAILARAPVDIIVSDVTMPEMGGLEFCERVRQSPAHVDIPFIFLTAHGGAGERMRGLRSGADEYLVKPVNAGDLVARVEILYDRIRRTRSVSTLKGNLQDVSLCEILQLFELTRKQGILHIEAPTGRGEFAVAEGALAHAVWNDLAGEDAVYQMFTLSRGEFRFRPTTVAPGNVVQPIGFALMEMARLTDELATVEGHIPAGDAPLVLRGPYAGEDPDAQAAQGAIAAGCARLSAVQRALRVSDVRLRLAVGKLIEAGCVAVSGAPLSPQTEAPGARPAKLLVAFTDDRLLSRCLPLLGEAGGRAVQRSGLSDFSRVTVGSQAYDVVCLRGEMRFSFMWELALKTAGGGIFLLATDADKEHAAFFSARAACLGKPVVRVCLGATLRNPTGVRVVATPEDMHGALAVLQSAAR